MVADGELFEVKVVNSDGSVATASNAKTIACGGAHTVVIKDDNSVWSVGWNNHGQLGDGTTDNRSSFINTGISGISVACGHYHTVVIKDDNSVWSVGYNGYGQLGDGTTMDRHSFVNTGISALVVSDSSSLLNYSVTPVVSLSSAPTEVYGLSKVKLNNTTAPVLSVDITNNVITQTLDTVDFADTRTLITNVDLFDGNEFTEFTGDLIVQG